MCKRLKNDTAGGFARSISDSAKGYKYSEIFRSSLECMAIRYVYSIYMNAASLIYTNMLNNYRSRIKLNHEQISAMQIPNTHASLHCFGWMDYYFSLMGCRPPNAKSNELHLESITIEEIHEEYSGDMRSINEKPVDVSQFGKLWISCFSK